MLLGLLPAVLVVVAYARARIGCGREPDPTSCLAYLDGSPLLLLLVIVVALAAARGGRRLAGHGSRLGGARDVEPCRLRRASLPA